MELFHQSVLVSFRPTAPWRKLLVPFLREVLAITMMCILLVIPQFTAVYGRVAFIMVVTVGSQPRKMSIGKALRSSVINVLATFVSTAYALMVGAILYAIDPTGASNTAISRWAALTVFVLITTLLRARFPDMMLAQTIACISCTLLLFDSVSQGLPLATTRTISTILICVFCFAECIALFCTCAVQPIIARREYRQAIGNELNSLGEILEESIQLLVKKGDSEKDVKDLRSKLALSRASGPAVEQWQIEASLELGPSFWRAPQAANVVRALYIAATTIRRKKEGDEKRRHPKRDVSFHHFFDAKRRLRDDT